MADVYPAAMLVAAAAWESSVGDGSRKALVVRVFTRAHLVQRSPIDAVDAPPEDLKRFKELWDGALIASQDHGPDIALRAATPASTV